FQMLHGTYGTLGIISKLTFKLIPAKPFIKLTHELYNSLESYNAAIWQHFQNQDIDFMDGIIHSPTQYALCIANFVDTAPYTHNYNWTKVYFESTKKLKEDFLKTSDYFFRYEQGVTSVFPKSFLGRLLFGKFTTSSSVLRIAEKFHHLLSENHIPVNMDLFIPFSKVKDFFEWYNKEINFYPLWCAPYKVPHNYEWLSEEFFQKSPDKLFLDIAIYGLPKKEGKNYYRILEEKLMEIGGVKGLLSNSYYSESEFWKIWNKKNYDQIKTQTDPHNIFRNLYTKMCKTMRGLE
ncbi:MAG TPA: FAD-binding oxidoreductase, partial [Candidatus Limnocylindria bacterium]|nr:FAD-binding oxidoreductase [Candidatus Limnocylindria bacterium]